MSAADIQFSSGRTEGTGAPARDDGRGAINHFSLELSMSERTTPPYLLNRTPASLARFGDADLVAAARTQSARLLGLQVARLHRLDGKQTAAETYELAAQYAEFLDVDESDLAAPHGDALQQAVNEGLRGAAAIDAAIRQVRFVLTGL